MKYYLKNKIGYIIVGIIIDEIAKQDFRDLMFWNEEEWNKYTIREDEVGK